MTDSIPSLAPTDSGPPDAREAWIALGSSVADPLRAVSVAAAAVVATLGLRHVRCSSLWRTPPAESASGGPFINAVLHGTTAKSPLELLVLLQGIELAFGRNRQTEGFHGARPLDLDLLAVGEETLALPELILPHPRLHQRHFVLGPLAEIAPDWQHPRRLGSAHALWASLVDASPAHGCEVAAPSPLESK